MSDNFWIGKHELPGSAEPPKLHERAASIATVLAFACTLIGSGLAVTIATSERLTLLEAHDKQAQAKIVEYDQLKVQRAEALAEIRADVRWIREKLEKMQ